MQNYNNENYKIERGDIYWIHRGNFEDGGENTIRSDRPAIIVSNDEINGRNFNYEIVFLTTQPKYDRNTHVTIRSSNKTSTALCEQVTTVSAEQIGNYIGQCTAEEMAMVDSCMMISLGLDVETATSGQIAPEDEPLPTPGIKTMVETGPEEDDEEYNEYVVELEEELIRAKAEADTIRKMYNELLERTLKG